MNTIKAIYFFCLMILCLAACRQDEGTSDKTGWSADVNAQTGGYFSPLDIIHDHNVSTLGVGWRLRENALLTESPIVGNGVMYVRRTDGEILAFDVETGLLLWQTSHSGGTENSICCGKAGQLLLHDEKLFAVTSSGHLSARSAISGKELWASQEQFSPLSGLLVSAGNVVLLGEERSAGKNVLKAYDMKTGDVKWSHCVADCSAETVFLSPVVADPDTNLLYFMASEAQQKEDVLHESGRMQTVISSAVVAIDGATGALSWTREISFKGAPEPLTSPLLARLVPGAGKEQKVLLSIASSGTLYILEPATGQIIEQKHYFGSETERVLGPMTYNGVSKWIYQAVQAKPDGWTGNPDTFISVWDPAEGKHIKYIPSEFSEACGGGPVMTAGRLILLTDKHGYLNIFSPGHWGGFVTRVYLGGCLSGPITYMAGKTQYISVISAASRKADGNAAVYNLKLGGENLTLPDPSEGLRLPPVAIMTKQ